MAKGTLVEIEWSDDEYDCDTCGISFAEGAIVKVDGEVILNKPAYAHCYNGTHVDHTKVYESIFKALGVSIKETFNGNARLEG